MRCWGSPVLFAQYCGFEPLGEVAPKGLAHGRVKSTNCNCKTSFAKFGNDVFHLCGCGWCFLWNRVARLHWEGNYNLGTFSDSALDIDLPPDHSDQALDNRHTKSYALRLPSILLC